MPEQIGILLLFLAVVLFNLVTGFLARRRERRTEAEAKGRSPAPPAPRPSPRSTPAPPRVDVPPPRPSAMHPRRRTSLKRTSLRHAIVMMTVLGRPRAFADEDPDRL
jgi:hypothetical protein